MIFAPPLAARSTRSICFARLATASAEQAICVRPMLTMREEVEFLEFRFIEYQTHLEMGCSIICHGEQKPFDIVFHLTQAVLGSVIDFSERFDKPAGLRGAQGAGSLFKERKLLAVFPRVLE